MKGLALGILIFLPNLFAAEDELSIELQERLRRIQVEHAPEALLECGSTLGSSERALDTRLGLRLYTREDSSALALIRHNRFVSRNNSRPADELVNLWLAWLRENQAGSFALFAQSGHRGAPGGGLRYRRNLQGGAALAFSAQREPLRDGLNSLSYDERRDLMKIEGYFDFLPPFYASLDATQAWHELTAGTEAHARITTLSGRIGVSLSNNDRHAGWQFYNTDLMVGGGIRRQLDFFLAAQLAETRGDTQYESLIFPTRRSRPLFVGTRAGLPLSGRFAAQAGLEVGGDQERNVDFGQRRLFALGLLWVPTHRAMAALNAEHSTENTGAIRGNISRLSLTTQVNF